MKLKRETVILGKKNFFYWQRNKTHKEVIVFLHGFPGNHMGLVELSRQFGENYRVIIPDLPGCGESDILKGRNILKNYADWLNSFFETLGIEKAIVVGHSFGSRLALVFSAHYHNKIKNLILITPVIKVDNFLDRLALIEYRISKILPKSFYHTLFSSRLYQYFLHRILCAHMNKRRKIQVAGWDFKEYNHLNPQIRMDLFDEFYKTNLALIGKKIRSKTLVIAGDEDVVANLNEVRELVGFLKNVELKVMKNTGHLAPVQKPLVVSGLIGEWLKGIDNTM